MMPSATASSSSLATMLDTCRYHYEQGNVNWPMVVAVLLVHCVAIMGLLRVPCCSHETLLWAFLLWPISGFGITVGAHRLWSHRSFEAHWIVRLGLMICNSIANQGTIYHWSRDHRIHHKYVETDADPHNALRGFFFAHVGWLLLKKHPHVISALRTMDVSDILEDPIVRLQRIMSPWFAVAMCYIFPAVIANQCWNEPFGNALLVAGGLRYVCVLHFTFLVNSAAHLMGDHPYDTQSYPAENPWVSFFAIGEGWHNWHHKYPIDYATSEFGISSQFNPSKLVIDTFAFMGGAWGLKRGTGAWALGRVRRDREGTALRKSH